MYLILIFLPLLGSILSGVFGRKLGVKGSQIITSSFVIITTILSIIAFLEVGFFNTPVLLSLFTWIDSESLNVKLSFYFDSLTISMLIPVLIVSSLVHIYSIGYMKGDPHNQRFFSYLSLFTFMMIILVTSNNLLLMFVGWEGVGVCSYLLVNFWFTRIAANQSSISAFLTNRVGDCFLTIGMFAILWSFGNIDYSTVFSLAPFISENIIILIGVCLLIGAMAKSSQFGLHVWLPMAMEGPTPVSALIHAATMVTAGVYLLMRASPLIEYNSTVLLFCLLLGAITTIFSSLIGLFQQDIKKVIAYSTMSQLGMMVIAVGLSSYNIALFHLINHAFYKALLFLGAGSVIHAVSDNQDFRKFGALKSFLPLTYSVMLIASLSLIAFPFMTGFYSKDFILEVSFGTFSFSSTIVYIIATIAAIFTTLYSVKILYLTFITNPNGSFLNHKNAHEGDVFISIPLILLAIFSIFFGFIFKDIFIGIGSDFFSDNSLFIHSSNESLIDTEFAINSFYKLLPFILSIILSILFVLLAELIPKLVLNMKYSNLGYNIYSLFNQRFFIELFYNKYIINFILKLGGQTTKVLDKGSIEYFGPFGLEKFLINFSKNMSKLHSKIITNYALFILLGFMLFLSLYYLSFFNVYYIIIMYISLFISFFYKNKYNKIKILDIYNFRHIQCNLKYLKYLIFLPIPLFINYSFLYGLNNLYIILFSKGDFLNILFNYISDINISIKLNILFNYISDINISIEITTILFILNSIIPIFICIVLLYLIYKYFSQIIEFFMFTLYLDGIFKGLFLILLIISIFFFYFGVRFMEILEIFKFIFSILSSKWNLKLFLIDFYNHFKFFFDIHNDYALCGHGEELSGDYFKHMPNTTMMTGHGNNDNPIPNSPGRTLIFGSGKSIPVPDPPAQTMVPKITDVTFSSGPPRGFTSSGLLNRPHGLWPAIVGVDTPESIECKESFELGHKMLQSSRLTNYDIIQMKYKLNSLTKMKEFAQSRDYFAHMTTDSYDRNYNPFISSVIPKESPVTPMNVHTLSKEIDTTKDTVTVFVKAKNCFMELQRYNQELIPRAYDTNGWGTWIKSHWEREIDTDLATGELKRVTLSDLQNRYISVDKLDPRNKGRLLWVVKVHYSYAATWDTPVTNEMTEALTSKAMPEKYRESTYGEF